MPVTSTAVLAAVSGLIRVGRAGQDAYREMLSRRDVRLIPPAFSRFSSDSLADEALDFVRRTYFAEPGQSSSSYDALFTWEGESRRRPAAPIARFQRQLDAAIDELTAALEDREAQAQSLSAPQSSFNFSPVVTLQHSEWLADDSPNSPWKLFGLELARTALDIADTYPTVVGLEGTAAAIVDSFAPSIHILLDEGAEPASAKPEIGQRLIRTFVGGATAAAVRHPELFAGEERWRPVISAFVLPLHDEIRRNNSLELVGHRKLRDLLNGPMAHAAISAVHADSSAFFGNDDIPGEVARRVFGDLVSVEASGFRTSSLVSASGARRVYTAALRSAQARPELFIHGRDDETIAGRAFLSQVAGALDNAPRPYNRESGLGPEIAAIAFDVAADYAQSRITANIELDDQNWERVWEQVAGGIVGNVFAGFSAGLEANGSAQTAFERVFNREQAVDVVRIIATQIAATPNMVVGDDANPEVRNIASGVAQMVAQDELSLLSGDDWRAVVGETVRLASANPGALFSINEDASRTGQVAVRLVGKVLDKAGERLHASAAGSAADTPDTPAAAPSPNGPAGASSARRLGRILFGGTLRTAISDSLAAASNSILARLEPVASMPDPVGAHLDELGVFIDRLLEAAHGENRELAMSAGDWAHVFKYYVAYILENGPGATAAIDDDAIRDLLRAA